MTSGNSATAVVAAKPRITAAVVHNQLHDLIVASQAWVQTHWLKILIASSVGTVIVILLHGARMLGRRLCLREEHGTGWGTIFARAVARTGNPFIVTLAAKLVAGYAGAPVEVAETIGFAFTVATVFQAAIWAREIILGAIEHRTSSDHYSGETLANATGLIRILVTAVLFAIALVVVLDNLGVNVTGLIAGLGVGGIAIGLAAQGIFADLFAALAIIFDRPFRRGDAISYDKSTGVVETIGLKSTRVRGPDGEERIISNRNLLDKEILNNTRREYRRIKFTLGVVQTTPVATMERLPGMLREEVEARGARFVRAGFLSFGASSYDFEVEFDSLGAAFQDGYDKRHVVGLAIIRRLGAEGIALAYPTQTAISATEAGMSVPDNAPVPDSPAMAADR